MFALFEPLLPLSAVVFASFQPSLSSFVTHHIPVQGDVQRTHPYYFVFARNGRSPSRQPNIQATPRTGGYREAIVASPGKVLLSIDYSFIEVWHGGLPMFVPTFVAVSGRLSSIMSAGIWLLARSFLVVGPVQCPPSYFLFSFCVAVHVGGGVRGAVRRITAGRDHPGGG